MELLPDEIGCTGYSWVSVVHVSEGLQTLAHILLGSTSSLSACRLRKYTQEILVIDGKRARHLVGVVIVSGYH